ncbi:18618_t:CDS:2, partial [Funneliformis geosporum]
HDNQMFRLVLNNEGEACRNNWKLTQNLQAYAQIQRRDGQITEHRRTLRISIDIIEIKAGNTRNSVILLKD